MSTLSTIDKVENPTSIDQAVTPGEGVSAVISSDPGLREENPTAGKGDGQDTMAQSSELQPQSTIDATPTEGVGETSEPAGKDLGQSTTPTSAGSQSPASPEVGGIEQGEGRSPDTSYEVAGPATTSTNLTEKVTSEESLAYGEISLKDLANPEQYSNEFFEIKKSDLGGNGIFAKVDLKRGQVILAESPTISASPVNLYRELEKLAPEVQEAFYRLHCHRRSSDQDERHAIFMTNAFAIDELSCVYMIGSRFNHACPPLNLVGHRVVDHRVMEFRMKKDVPAGTELTIAYGLLPPWQLYRMWGFRCACGGCTPITDEEVARVDGKSDAEGIW
ncbi:hypothetical protein M434DRAFT_31899 [Hypoxylon sp. CO27-5]|nr:hypothetical protein M434DRAFT_31899 [Hypoxylon sp. CO27-5]